MSRTDAEAHGRRFASRQHAAAVNCLLMLAAVAGCQTATPAARHSTGPSEITEDMSLDQALGTDPCAARMRDIEGCLLMYYALHKQLPPSLGELSSLADVDQPLNFTSPVTHARFGYSAGGLVAPGRSKRIIVYETVPEHEGRRWCIRMPLTVPDAAQSTEVVELGDADFGHYLKND